MGRKFYDNTAFTENTEVNVTEPVVDTTSPEPAAEPIMEVPVAPVKTVVTKESKTEKKNKNKTVTC